MLINDSIRRAHFLPEEREECSGAVSESLGFEEQYEDNVLETNVRANTIRRFRDISRRNASKYAHFSSRVEEENNTNETESLLHFLQQKKYSAQNKIKLQVQYEWIICDFTRRRASVLARKRITSLPKKVGTLDDMPVRVLVRSGR
ncbi:hypothetical protein LguiB_006265 [Lonicera macranthoides]